MKIAVPTRNHMVDDHFGHCAYYTIFTIGENRQIVNIEILDSPEGCGCKSNIASVLEEKGVEWMLAGNMGEGAKQTLETHHIRVVRGCSGEARAVVDAWLNGKITDSGDSCQHHDCPDSHSLSSLSFKVIK